MVKVSKSVERYSRNDERLDKKSRKKLRSALTVGKKFLVLAERLRKKDAPVIYIKAQREIHHFLIEMRYL